MRHPERGCGIRVKKYVFAVHQNDFAPKDNHGCPEDRTPTSLEQHGQSRRYGAKPHNPSQKTFASTLPTPSAAGWMSPAISLTLCHFQDYGMSRPILANRPDIVRAVNHQSNEKR
jgi:hypothetical protein